MIGYGKRILVVDDRETMRLLITEQLVQQGFLVVQASDGRQALNELYKCRFDAVITDYHIPNCSGLDLLRQSRMAWPDLPVIIVSGSYEQIAELATARGAFACLPKPFDPNLFLCVLTRAVDQHVPS